MNKTMPIERKTWLDALKGFGMLWVMISHAIIPPAWGMLFITPFMPLFFIASGYTTKPEDCNTAIKRKAKRLLLPYMKYGIVLTLIFTCLRFLVPDRLIDTAHTHEWWGLLYSRFCFYEYGHQPNVFFLPMETTSTLWYLTALFSGFVFYYIALSSQRSRSIQLVGIATYTVVCTLSTQLPVLLPWSIDTALLVAVFIWIGREARASNYIENLVGFKKHFIGIGAIIMYLILYFFNGDANFSIRYFGQLGMASVPLFLLLGTSFFVSIAYVFMTVPKIIVSPIAMIGRHTMTLMCVQMIILYVVKQMFTCITSSLAMAVISIAACIIVTIIIDRSKLKT